MFGCLQEGRRRQILTNLAQQRAEEHAEVKIQGLLKQAVAQRREADSDATAHKHAASAITDVLLRRLVEERKSTPSPDLQWEAMAATSTTSTAAAAVPPQPPSRAASAAFHSSTTAPPAAATGTTAFSPRKSPRGSAHKATREQRERSDKQRRDELVARLLQEKKEGKLQQHQQQQQQPELQQGQHTKTSPSAAQSQSYQHRSPAASVWTGHFSSPMYPAAAPQATTHVYAPPPPAPPTLSGSGATAVAAAAHLSTSRASYASQPIAADPSAADLLSAVHSGILGGGHSFTGASSHRSSAGAHFPTGATPFSCRRQRQ